MKKITVTVRLLMIAILLLPTVSCNDFLDIDPINTQTEDTAWDSDSEVNSNVLGIYYKMREQMNFGNGLNFFTYGDFPTQIYSNESLWDLNPFTGQYQWAGNDAKTNWKDFYKVLLSTNLAIKKIPETPLSQYSNSPNEAEIKQKSYIGEALFMRAFTYFYMVRIWGEVPLVLEPTQDASEVQYNVSFETEDNILKQCLADLDLAAKYLTWKPTKNSVATRANKGSIYALKAHIHMWLTRPNRKSIDIKNFEYAISACDSIEANGGYNLVDIENLKTIWSPGKSKESIFEFPYSVSNNEYFAKNAGFTDRFLGYPYNTDRKDMKPVFVFNPTFLAYFDQAKDKRVTQLFENFANSSQCFTTKYSSIQYTNTDKTDWKTDDDVVIFRLADIYLLKAEAYSKTNDDTKARLYLNKVRARAGLDDYSGSSAALYREISDERDRELFLEGHRLYDWVRTGFYYQKTSSYDQTRYNKEGYLWPVNYEILIDNVYARQTPYWADKMQN